MSHEIFGETFDIHGGGLDLVFPHHENEMAQSECCHGKPMVRYWMHNGLMKAAAASGKVGGRSEREQEQADVDTKISRSKGAGGLADLIQAQGGERLRFFLLRTHYRSTIVFGEEPLAEAGTGLDTFYRFFERFERVTGQSFYALEAATRRSDVSSETGSGLVAGVAEKRKIYLERMDDDFNTGAAVSELFELVRMLNKFIDGQSLEDPDSRSADDLESLTQGAKTLKELSGILGIFQKPAESAAGGNDELVDQLMQLMIQLRASARGKKDFETADQIRDGLTELGITLEDRKDGTGWKIG